MAVVNISKAKAQLSALVEKVLAGEEVIIGRAGKPVAKLVPFERPSAPRRAGVLAGRIEIADDFDELPNELEQAFGIEER
jgi:prevent-host-death family protein